MFIAINKNGERISVENATKEERYFCPVCGEPLNIRAQESVAVTTHFAHKRGTVCYDNWTHDMSEWHRSWQERFPEECREVVIEKNGKKHRADVLINNTVIEFQHSPIKGEEIAERNNFYLTCGYKIVWVFDATNQIKNRSEKSIDPAKCKDNDLCWKRQKQQFSSEYWKDQAAIYLQYKTCISVKGYENKEIDIMLLLTNFSSKEFIFYKSPIYKGYHYITCANFLKEYGVSVADNVLSVTDIRNIEQPYYYVKRQAEPTQPNTALNNWIMSAIHSKPRKGHF